MQKTNNIIIKAALAFLTAVMATGCIFEKYDMPKDLQSVMIQINVDAEKMTKSALTSTEEAVNSVRIYAFDGHRMAGHFFRGTASDDPIIMDLLMPDTGIYDIDFYVIVNEAAMTLASDVQGFDANMTKARLADIRFISINSLETNGLPMYGNASVSVDVENVLEEPSSAAGHEGHYILDYNVNIEIYRPLAKVSVYAAKGEGNDVEININDVMMQARGTRQYGYLFNPSSAAVEAVPAGTEELDMLSEAVEVTKMITSDQMEKSEYYDEVSSGIYLMEVPFGSPAWNVPVEDDVDAAVLEVSYTKGSASDAVGYVYMPEIKRNTHYKVFCFMASEREVEITYIVRPWTEEYVEVPEFN